MVVPDGSGHVTSIVNDLRYHATLGVPLESLQVEVALQGIADGPDDPVEWLLEPGARAGWIIFLSPKCDDSSTGYGLRPSSFGVGVSTLRTITSTEVSFGWEAWEWVRANAGAARVDVVTLAVLEA